MERIVVVSESALEPVTCDECGCGNVLDAPSTCKSCDTLRQLLFSHLLDR